MFKLNFNVMLTSSFNIKVLFLLKTKKSCIYFVC